MIDVKMLQKQRQRAYLNEWQADEHDPAAILQDIGIEMLMRTQASFCLLYTSPSPRDLSTSRMPSSA